MRKHKIRKILHGLLDLLPLIVIPVFMIYSHRHTIDDYSVTRTEYEKINVVQNVLNGLPDNTNDYISFDNASRIESGDFSITSEWVVNFNMADTIVAPNDKVYCKASIEAVSNDILMSCDFGISLLEDFTVLDDDTYQVSVIVQNLNEEDILLNEVLFYGVLDHDSETLFIGNVQVFNLTEMFGVGNEPTIEEFNVLFPNDYYPFDSTAYTFVPVEVTYNSNDIGSQFVYSLYNTTTQYFNTDSVFNLKDLHNWISNNMFKGNMPLGVTIVYHIVVYEFIMDIIFLIYAVLMFVVDFATDFLEYCFSWSRRGGR